MLFSAFARIGSRSLLVLIGLLMLSACGGGSPSGVVPTATFIALTLPANGTAQPAATTNVTGAACDTSQLENWVARSRYGLNGFMALLNSSASIAPDQALNIGTQLAGFQGGLINVTTPACALDERVSMFALMEAATNGFSDYSAHKTTSLAATIKAANTAYETLKVRQAQVDALLNAKLSTPTP